MKNYNLPPLLIDILNNPLLILKTFKNRRVSTMMKLKFVEAVDIFGEASGDP